MQLLRALPAGYEFLWNVFMMFQIKLANLHSIVQLNADVT